MTPSRSSEGRRQPLAVARTSSRFNSCCRDPRVDAWHAKKMTARLQRATSADQPILLRMVAGGHGVGQSLDDHIGLWADYYTFFFDRLGLTYR